jgi:hypothetical protein
MAGALTELRIMNLDDFPEPQRLALLDLLVLAMYMDGNLASSEEARVQEVLVGMGLTGEYERNRVFDASVTRVRQQAQTPEAARTCAAKLAKSFTTPDHRRRVYNVLSQLTALDGQVSAEESKLLAVLRDVLKL